MEPENNAADSGGDSADIVVTDKELFDHAISTPPPDQPAEAAKVAPEAAPPQPQPQEHPGGDRRRDEHGRFVAGQPPQQPQQQPGQPQQPQQQPQQQRLPEDHRVPLRELLAEREQRQKAQAEMAQMREAWAYFQNTQLQPQQQPQQPQQPQQVPQTIFDNPDQYLAERVISPLQQWGQDGMLKIKDGLSRAIADQQFGAQAINAALADIASIRYTPQGDFQYRQIMASGHPYGELIKWHQQARAHQAIGPDPNAWLRKQQEAWFNDPNVQARMIEHVRRQQQHPGANRPPPTVNLPPSLSSLPASSGRLDDQGDLSDASLYRFATR